MVANIKKSMTKEEINRAEEMQIVFVDVPSKTVLYKQEYPSRFPLSFEQIKKELQWILEK